MRGDHLDDLVLVGAPALGQVGGDSEVLVLAVALGERLVRDGSDEVLQEAVLPSLGRARVGLERHNLLADERGEQLVDRVAVHPGQRCQRLPAERLADDGRVLQQAPLGLGEAVETGRDERVQGLWDIQRADGPDRTVTRALTNEEPAVDQHAHGLDGIEGHAFGALEDLLAHLGRQPRHEPGDQLGHGCRRQRLEVDRGEVPATGAPARPSVDEVGPGEGEDEDGVVSRPVEEVLDEVQQRRVRPLHVLERHDDGLEFGQPLEEEPPRREEVLLVAGGGLLEADEMGEPRLDPLALVGVRDVALHGRVELGGDRGRLFALEDLGSAANHLRQGPVGDALAVGKATSPVPEEEVGEPVHVLVELPRQAALADAGYAGHRHEVSPLLLSRAVKQVLHEAKLPATPDERRLETFGLERAADAGDHAQRLVELRSRRLALELVGAGVGVRDRGIGCPPCRLVHIAATRWRHGLDPGGSVDPVADDEAFLGRPGRSSLPGHDSDPGGELEVRVLGAEGGDCGHELEPCADGSFGIVLLCRRHAPDRHHGVADELLDDTAVAGDDARGRGRNSPREVPAPPPDHGTRRAA